MIQIEERPLSTLNEDCLARVDRTLDRHRDLADLTPEAVRYSEIFIANAVNGKCESAGSQNGRDLLGGGSPLGSEGVGVEKTPSANAAPADFAHIRGPDATPGSAQTAVTALLLLEAVK